jgi:hypothetical protein|tara:strand:+ start:25020 stop:25187 length:168 start_codon:yes stop_codon:yes gene_type:complete
MPLFSSTLDFNGIFFLVASPSLPPTPVNGIFFLVASPSLPPTPVNGIPSLITLFF